jgi:uncharacterized membrane protein
LSFFAIAPTLSPLRARIASTSFTSNFSGVILYCLMVGMVFP